MRMKKVFSILVALLSVCALNAKTLYLKAGTVDFMADGAVVAIWTWGGSDADAWSVFSATSTTGISSTTIAEGRTGGKIVRWPGGTTPNWENESSAWNITGDLTWDGTKNCMELIPNGDGTWNGLTGVTWTDYEGGTTPPTPGTGLEESGEDHIFALIGSIGGDWNVQEQLDEYKFDARGRWSGTLKTHPAKENISYVVIMDEEGNQYKTKGWQGENATKVTLYWANGFEDSNVWQLPAAQTIYLIMRKCTFKGSIEVEKVDQATYNAYTIDWGTTPTPGTAIQNVSATLDINAPMFDILGRKVNADYKGIVIQNGQKYIR